LIVRDVDAKLKPGQTEKLKVGSVIRDELAVAAAMSGVVIGASPRLGAGTFGAVRPGQRAMSGAAALSSDRSFLDRAQSTFPVPIPYPRPHP
jgi:hypothetical protein